MQHDEDTFVIELEDGTVLLCPGEVLEYASSSGDIPTEGCTDITPRLPEDGPVVPEEPEEEIPVDIGEPVVEERPEVPEVEVEIGEPAVIVRPPAAEVPVLAATGLDGWTAFGLTVAAVIFIAAGRLSLYAQRVFAGREVAKRLEGDRW